MGGEMPQDRDNGGLSALGALISHLLSIASRRLDLFLTRNVGISHLPQT